MSWEEGHYLAENVWVAVRSFVPLAIRRDVAAHLIHLFQVHDAHEWDEDSTLCKDAGLWKAEGYDL